MMWSFRGRIFSNIGATVLELQDNGDSVEHSVLNSVMHSQSRLTISSKGRCLLGGDGSDAQKYYVTAFPYTEQDCKTVASKLTLAQLGIKSPCSKVLNDGTVMFRCSDRLNGFCYSELLLEVSPNGIVRKYDLVGSGHDYGFNAVEYRGCVDIIVHKNIWYRGQSLMTKADCTRKLLSGQCSLFRTLAAFICQQSRAIDVKT